MRVRIDPETCFLCGLCAEIAPAIFEIECVDVRAAFERVPPGHERVVYEAASRCPRGAIWLAEVPGHLVARGS
jgi:ferredoxin